MAQQEILIMLKSYKGFRFTVSEIAEHIGINKRSVQDNLKQMTKYKLVNRFKESNVSTFRYKYSVSS